jgi:cell division GTPase FtsZ
MGSKGVALMGVGIGLGRAQDGGGRAARDLLAPLLDDVSIVGATGADQHHRQQQPDDVRDPRGELADPGRSPRGRRGHLGLGRSDETPCGDEARVTVIATGFESSVRQRARSCSIEEISP